MYDFGEEELKALENLFKKKRLYRYSPEFTSECDLFEKEFSAHFQVKHSLLLSSGTNALVAALLSLNIRPGDEVIVPIYTFVATVNAVLTVGAVPILVENDSELGYNLVDLENKISEKTKAIIVVHMDGLVSNIQGVQKICAQRCLFLIEDAAQALGAELQGKKVGTFGDIGCFSLNENKVLTCGEGGVLITNDSTLFERAYCIHDTPSQFSPSRKGFYKNIKPFAGQSMRVSEIQGTIMRVQLRKLESILSRLRKTKAIFRETLSPFMITGSDPLGDCGTTILLRLDHFQHAGVVGKALLEKGIKVQSLTARPAHAGWKWFHLINEHLGGAKYTLLDFANSIPSLSSILRIEVDINCSEDVAKRESLIVLESLKKLAQNVQDSDLEHH